MTTAEPNDTPGLKLAVFDADDLAVLSAHLQDSTVDLADVAFLPKARRFVLVVSRVDQAAALRGRHERCRAGLHFERVFKVSRSGIDQRAGVTLHLLAIAFTPGDAPSGVVTLHFADGGAIRLDVECLEAGMSDLGPRWLDADRQIPEPAVSTA